MTSVPCLCGPSQLPRRLPLARFNLFQTDLDDTKKSVVQIALGTKDFLLVEGPPGTGKTTFITEIVLQTLKLNPDARILLISSQTHVALDNAVERLQKFQGNLKIVSLGRLEDSRIASTVKPLVLENQYGVMEKRSHPARARNLWMALPPPTELRRETWRCLENAPSHHRAGWINPGNGMR